MSKQSQELIKFLSLLQSCGCLEHVVLIGSWAEFLYGETKALPDFEPNIKTMDVDFLVQNLRKPSPAVNVVTAAREAGYLVERDTLDGITKLYDPKGIEIEFLIGKKGAGIESALKTNLGVTAQALRHLEILSRNIMHVAYAGMTVCIPEPEAYALHKIVINHERNRKREKDAQAIANLWPHLNQERLLEISRQLSKKERLNFDIFVQSHSLE